MTHSANKTTPWKQALTDAITDPHELITLLELNPELLPKAKAAAKSFPLKVPLSFLNRIRKGDPNDPLLQQILPMGAELEVTPGYDSDPLQENKYNPVSGLLHKYQGRVLLTFTSVCGINCRYCFRRHFPYEENNPGTQGWQKALDYIANDPSISEVILSGGDPLIANDQTFKNFTLKLAEIKTITRFRIHSRMPIVLPERITPEFISAITSNAFKTILVVHCNHPNELSPDVTHAMHLLTNAGIVLLNQSVLLKNVNDSAPTLIALSEALFKAHILPYYLHVLDKVQGAAHFDLSRDQSILLHTEMAKALPGYLVPKLVCEQPGAASKLPVTAQELCTN
jgi:EF-P beta-lysylation protein EpmB